MSKEKKVLLPVSLLCVCVRGLLWSWFFLRLEIVNRLVDKDIITIVVVLLYYCEDDNDDNGLLWWGWVIGLITGRTRKLSLMAGLERLCEVIPPFRTSHLAVLEVLRFPAPSLKHTAWNETLSLCISSFTRCSTPTSLCAVLRPSSGAQTQQA